MLAKHLHIYKTFIENFNDNKYYQIKQGYNRL